MIRDPFLTSGSINFLPLLFMRSLSFFLLFLPLVFLFSCGGEEAAESGSGTFPEVRKIDFYEDSATGRTLTMLLKDEISAGRKPVVMFTASWCGPCKAFKKTLHSNLVRAAFDNATLIMVDIDVDAEKDQHSFQYGVSEVPTFIRMDAEGNQLKRITSAEWGRAEPSRVAAVIKAFLND